jgi:outer membrane lipoprotein-sorting protein
MDIDFYHICTRWLLQLLLIASQGLGVETVYAAQGIDNAQQIVTKADEIRFPQDDFQADVTITSTDDGSTDVHKYQILSKGRDKTVVITIYPPIERGQILLMKDRDLWAYMPNISQPIRLSLAQRLTGQVANGDLTRANFSNDYKATFIKNETIDGRNYAVLNLDAVDRSVTYHRVIYWVNTVNSHPYKAEFYSVSGRLMKTCLYDDFRKMEGKIRPTRMIMEDALHKGLKSVLEYSNMRTRKIPDKVFTKDYLKKLQ